MRFIINLPQEELGSVERICFQVEEAQWFYEDFVRPLDPDLPTLSLRDFCLRIFQHCPLLSEFSSYHHSAAFSEFLAYKTRVPVRGAIMINQDMTEVVLVKGWKKGASWSFPRGKINKDEPDLDCAIREVYEETGFDIKEAGLVAADEDMKYIDVTMREQHMRLYVFRGIPMDTYFEPRTRKEISKIQWYKLSELPTLKKKKQQQQEGRGEDLATTANKFYMVAPFLNPLNKWIAQQRKIDSLHNHESPNHAFNAVQPMDPSIDDQTLGNGPNGHPSPSDMGRLQADLRESEEVASMSDLPELSEPLEPTLDASAQLKDLLRVNSQAPLRNAAQPSAPIFNLSEESNTKGKDSNALLALLRGKETSHYQEPQTPLEQVMEQSALPRSLHHDHRHVALQHTSTLPQPPNFPYLVDPHPKSHGHALNFIHSSRPHLQTLEHSIPSRSYKRLATSHNLPAQQYHQLSSLIDSQPSPATTAHLHRQVPAPYQRTGDPEFSQRSQHSSNIPPTIPPASKLPPPKLTTHSSALLNLFKTKQATTIAPNHQAAKAETSHLRVVNEVGGSYEHSEVSPLTERSHERDAHITMDPNRRSEQQRSRLAMWGNFQATSKRQDADERRRFSEKDAERLAEEARTGIRHELQLPIMNETWRQVKINDQENQRRVVGVEKPAKVPRTANKIARNNSPSPTSNSVQESAIAEAGHPRNIARNLDKDIRATTTAASIQEVSPVLVVEPRTLGKSNSDHRATLLNLFRSPPAPVAQQSESAPSLVPPGPPVELSAFPSPGHSREASQIEYRTSGLHSQDTKGTSSNRNGRSIDKGRARKSPMSATVSGPLNVPNFDVIAQKPREVRGPAENSRIRNMQKGPSSTISSSPQGIALPSVEGHRKGSLPTRPATLPPPTVLFTDGTRHNTGTTPVPFQPQILRRPAGKGSLSTQPHLSSQGQSPHTSEEPPFFERRVSQPQGHRETLLSLFSKPAPLVSSTNFSSTTPINPLSERLAFRQGRSEVVSPLLSRSRVGSLTLSSGEGSSRRGAVQSSGDKKFLLGYLEGVAKERR